MDAAKPTNIDEYIAGFPLEIQKMLEEIRATVKEAAPGAKEAIKYGMPAFTLNGNLVYFAAYKNHIGFYPAPDKNKAFEKALAPYKTSGKGTVQFPLDKPLPLGLIEKIVKFRISENAKKKKINEK